MEDTKISACAEDWRARLKKLNSSPAKRMVFLYTMALRNRSKKRSSERLRTIFDWLISLDNAKEDGKDLFIGNNDKWIKVTHVSQIVELAVTILEVQDSHRVLELAAPHLKRLIQV